MVVVVGGVLLATNTFIQVYFQERSGQHEIRTLEIISRHGNKIKTWILHSTLQYGFHFILLSCSLSALFLALSPLQSQTPRTRRKYQYWFLWLTMWKMSDHNIRIPKESILFDQAETGWDRLKWIIYNVTHLGSHYTYNIAAALIECDST